MRVEAKLNGYAYVLRQFSILLSWGHVIEEYLMNKPRVVFKGKIKATSLSKDHKAITSSEGSLSVVYTLTSSSFVYLLA